jgi:hypothetical protein
MLISHKHKFILLHAGKCAGTSIRNFLDNIIDEQKIKMPKNHPNLSECQEIISKTNRSPEEYIVVGMVRNPFDRMVSWYFHALYKSKAFTGSFEDFCKERLLERVDPNENLIPPYEKCDHVIRYEHLQEDFNVFLDLIGHPPHKLPHSNSNPEKPKDHYRALYTDKTKQMTADYFASVIEIFGYEF